MNSNILIGGLICLVGVVITFGSYAAASGGGTYTLAWGAILFGGVQMVMGFMQGEQPGDDPELTEEQVNAAGTAVILRSMISMAAADGRLDDNEIAMVRAVTRSIFGSELDEATIREMSQKMMSGGGNLTNELAAVQHAVRDEDADLAVTGMAMVAMADGEMDATETERLETYSGALGVDQERFDNALEKARAAVAQLFEPKQDS